jgi:hypothetical protein
MVMFASFPKVRGVDGGARIEVTVGLPEILVKLHLHHAKPVAL